MKKIIFSMIAILLVLTMINPILAVQYFQQRYLLDDNVTTRVHSGIAWGSDMTKDHIKSGNPLEIYVWYNIYPKDWNQKNLGYQVDYCNFTILFLPHLASNYILYNDIIYNDENIYNGKHFIQLRKGDAVNIDIDCKFLAERLIETPADFTIVVPSWECQACQMYEWLLTEQDITKAKSIGDNVVETNNYIKDLITLNFEIWVSIFWLLLIFLALPPISLIFIGIYWLLLYLRNIAK